MKKYQETIYKIILIFSVVINLFLIVLMFFALRDSFSGNGEWFLEGRSFWFFIGVILAYSVLNCFLLLQIFKRKKQT
ncbi:MULTISPECIES: hypothetical protein [Epilithonimonas]|jgi:hypothetical protein|uniref:Uncharacterized protein n=2 Tax=Epilithonimonas TaxID=2782229 RepID=A0A3G8Y4R0_9FLAO|nr:MULTISPECIES: hypothetical protein [Epilithonimonas]QIY82805.1 hypothetical protein HER18_04250 [Chryseobacterium sp. NEB161]HAP94826.1 hypothetical protein [Chryseobacterium sp.]AZI40342.1 hypothetical protein EIB74_10370 [Epilithonimonas vandammei]AZI54985.1 hypothetical protein EIB75_06900 [Epilithonimonas vandammei]SIT96523.1 hypothetical protein SAMN05660493_01207 [Epilithonimonas bovis DSM 19482]